MQVQPLRKRQSVPDAKFEIKGEVTAESADKRMFVALRMPFTNLYGFVDLQWEVHDRVGAGSFSILFQSPGSNLDWNLKGLFLPFSCDLSKCEPCLRVSIILLILRGLMCVCRGW